MGRLLIIVGIVFIVAGVLISYGDKFSFFGKLPGDITVERENFKFHFPLASSIILSIGVSLILYLINRWRQ